MLQERVNGELVRNLTSKYKVTWYNAILKKKLSIGQYVFPSNERLHTSKGSKIMAVVSAVLTEHVKDIVINLKDTPYALFYQQAGSQRVTITAPRGSCQIRQDMRTGVLTIENSSHPSDPSLLKTFGLTDLDSGLISCAQICGEKRTMGEIYADPYLTAEERELLASQKITILIPMDWYQCDQTRARRTALVVL